MIQNRVLSQCPVMVVSDAELRGIAPQRLRLPSGQISSQSAEAHRRSATLSTNLEIGNRQSAIPWSSVWRIQQKRVIMRAMVPQTLFLRKSACSPLKDF